MCANVNMINLLPDELKLEAKNRGIKGCENKSENDLIKILSKLKPKIGVSKKKLKEIKKGFSELRHKFSQKEIDKFRKSFYNIKNYRNLSTVEIREAEKNLISSEESLWSKKFKGDDHNNEYQKIKSINKLFEGLYRDYYKPIKTDDSFGGKK